MLVPSDFVTTPYVIAHRAMIGPQLCQRRGLVEHDAGFFFSAAGEAC